MEKMKVTHHFRSIHTFGAPFDLTRIFGASVRLTHWH